MGKEKYKLHVSAMFSKGQHILLATEKQINICERFWAGDTCNKKVTPLVQLLAICRKIIIIYFWLAFHFICDACCVEKSFLKTVSPLLQMPDMGKTAKNQTRSSKDLNRWNASSLVKYFSRFQQNITCLLLIKICIDLNASCAMINVL